MLQKEFESDDPYELKGVGFPCPSGYDSIGEMARCFAEEFALMGHTRAFVLALFKSPRYQGPHGVYEARGDAYVQSILDEVYSEQEELNIHV